VLVDWPVESEHPRCCAFVYTPSRCPQLLAPVLERELAAREREELNGLYVAMTRAKSRLVFSATEPSRPTRRPWWQRVQPCVQAWAAEASTKPSAKPAGVDAQLRVLPKRVQQHRPVATPLMPARDDDEASRLGQAVHRVLEWAAAARHAEHAPLSALAAGAAQEFGVDEREVTRLAERIWLSPACARFFRGPSLRWSGNEVPVSDDGEVLRIDRLVELDEAGQRAWWVLDYKLRQAPDALPAYREQLRRYARAVQALQPGDLVRCAFITGAGELIELP
jgi:ATP-dependent helicase/nuclease subunit A